MRKIYLKVLILGFAVVLLSCKEKAIYQDSSQSVEARVNDLLSKMTLEEKIAIISGDSTGFDTPAIERLGIPAIRITDGPLGVRNGQATSFISGVAMGATWDTALVKEIGVAMGKETKAKGRNYLLGPCVGIHRFPLNGRNFESYSEDPYLASRLAVNWILGVQSEKVITSVKHFATNDQEWERNNYDVKVDDRALHETHLAPFEAAVKEADVKSVMAAYNLQNGQHCTENYHLISDILKGQWGYKGFVISDWVSVYSTVNAANAGLDLEMPVGVYFNKDSVLKYIQSGQIKESTIDDKVRRILSVAFWAGLFDNNEKADTTVLHGEAYKKLVLKSAQEAITLLKNEENILPLSVSKVKTIAVIGPNAAYTATGGGGSSFISPYYDISPLQGLKCRLGDSVKIVYSTGDSIPQPKIEPVDGSFLFCSSKNASGLWAEYYGNKELQGKPVLERLDKQVNFDYGTGSPATNIKPNFFSCRWTGELKVKETGKYNLQTLSDDGVRLFLNDKKVIENWNNHGPIVDQYETTLEAGKSYKIKLEYFEDGGGAVIKLGLVRINEKAGDPIENAAKVAASADVAIVFAGTNSNLESEGRDREGLELPGKQESLVKAVVKANKNTIVVINSGCPVNVSSWIKDVKALVNMYFIGQETGDAIASVLMGDVNPSGKLPFTYIADAKQSPAFEGYKKSLKVEYKEGVFVGYKFVEKNKMEPTYPFGFGISYTTFGYSNLKLKELAKNTYEVSVDITNTGSRSGDEVVQLYLSDKECSVARPIKELKGFSRVSLKAGETKTVSMKVKERDFAFWDVNTNGWKVEPGEFTFMVGSSSKDIKLISSIMLK
jgi:beta-glucosidase